MQLTTVAPIESNATVPKDRAQTADRSSSRIAVITNGAFSLSNFRGPLMREMIARGYTVYALAPDYDSVERAKVSALGAIPVDFALSRAGTNVLQDIVHTIRLMSLLRRLRVGTVFSYFIKPSIYGTLAARLAGVPRRAALIAGLGYAFTPSDGAQTLSRRVLATVVTLLFRTGLRFADTVFFQNDDDRSLFIDRRIVLPAKAIRLNGTGVDLAHFAALPSVIEPVTFLLMARLLREKGIYEYVEAARRLKRDFPAARFILLGKPDVNPGSLNAETVQLWCDEGVIEWPGHVDDVVGWIAQASVYVLPSWREGAPRSTQEALALARPVVTTEAPGCRDTVEEGVNGFKVPVRDVDELTRAMRRFLEDPSLIPPMGAASRKLAEQRYDVHVINAQMLEAMRLMPRHQAH